MKGTVRTVVLGGSLAAAFTALLHGQQAASILAPTNHPVLPRELSRLWFAPERSRASAAAAGGDFAAAMKLADREDYAAALPLLTRAAADENHFAQYAAYYAGRAALRLGRAAEARRLFRDLLADRPIGYLAEAAPIGEAEALEALEEYGEAVRIYQRVIAGRTTAPEDVLMRLGAAAKAAGNSSAAAEAFGRVLYDFPLADVAPLAESEYAALPNVQRIAPANQRYKLELGRAERLFGARRHADARKIYAALQPLSSGDDRELIDLRLAEADYFQRRVRAARTALRPYTTKGSRRGEALYFYALASLDSRDEAEYRRAMRQIVDQHPVESWAEDALDHLASTLIRADADADADIVLRELYDKYPRGRRAERAAWKVGWRAYREGRPAETVKYFEQASADFPRSDYRPAWLYWAGRAHARLDHPALARERFLLTAADYMNTYYGRLALRRLNGLRPEPRVLGEPTSALPPPPNEPIVRALLEIGRYDEALHELRYAQRAWGDSPAIQATIAWAYQQQGRTIAGGSGRFNLLRGSITLMRRAYPQFMAAGGEELPREILTVIFPLEYWDLIRKYSAQHDLDPYLVAALMAQESTFVVDIRSHANAYGLLQLWPPTARRLAPKLGMRYSSRLLTSAEPNIRMGTYYLAQLIEEFGATHLALASYNAGETAVRRWVRERPEVRDVEEFIDDIPYPETQNYVKRLLGTAEDYRRLYSPGSGN